MATLDEITDILSGRDEVVLRGDGELSRLWRIILKGLRVSPSRFESLLDNYVSAVGSTMGNDTVKDIKGNLFKALCDRVFTWSTFVRGLTMLNFRKTSVRLGVKKGAIELYSDISITTAGHIGSFSKLKVEHLDNANRELSRVWEEVRVGLYPEIEDWDSAVDRYLEDPSITHKGTKASIRNRLMDGTVSWKGFLTGLQIAGVEELLISVDLTNIKHQRYNLRVKMKDGTKHTSTAQKK